MTLVPRFRSPDSIEEGETHHAKIDKHRIVIHKTHNYATSGVEALPQHHFLPSATAPSYEECRVPTWDRSS
jgi:hypothetical protein